MKPATPILRNEHYLDVMTGGSASLPSPILREERYLAKLAGMDVSIPSPVTIKEKYYAKICGMDVDVPTYTRNMPRIYAYMAKAAGQTIEDLPTAVTREQRYWYDYVSEPPVTEHEYTGAVPYTFRADGTPLLDWYIKGNTVQSTTPTPDNPVMPQSCGERTENLYNKNSNTTNERGESRPGVNVPAGIYSISNGDTTPVYYRVGNNAPRQINSNTKAENINATDELYVWQGVRRNNVMLNTGSTALPYEPYGIKIPILSANTTTPVYLGEVETTRIIKKIIFDGQDEAVTLSVVDANRIVVRKTIIAVNGQGYCSHLGNNVSGDNKFVIASNTIYLSFALQIIGGDTLADVNAYFAQQYAAGTPVTVWYVLSSATTGIVNEPLMKIGDYADSLTTTQAGVTIPTNNGSTTIDVDTTVKPSEVYIKWKGV